jgi:murein DD-endopeptidase MepM/ murein hydrolase activator NlpD
MMLRWPIAEPGEVFCDYQGHHARRSGAPGIDIAVPHGTPVLAPANGQVLRSRYTRRAGRSMWLDVGPLRVFYSHLDRVLLLEGEDFEIGDQLATVGCTGQCVRIHLHIACKWQGQWIDPLRFFDKP